MGLRVVVADATTLGRRTGGTPAGSRVSGRIKAAWGRTITFRRSTVQAGVYAFAIRFSAAMSPSRVTVLASKPFRVTAPRR